MASSRDAETALAGALRGDARAMATLIDHLAPAVHAEVGGILRKRASARQNAEQEIEDLVQEVFAFLFGDGARALRAWRPDGGRALISFVRLLARHQTCSILRNAKRNPWTDEPMAPELVADAAGAIDGPEREIVSRQMLNRLLDRLLPELTPRGMLLFQVLYVEQRPPEDACLEAGLSREAVYSWRKRIKRTILRLAEEMDEPRGPVGALEEKR